MEIDLAQGEEKKSIHTAKKNSKDKGNTIGFKKEL